MAETNPTDAKQDQRKQTKTIIHLIHPFVIFKNPIIIPPTVIGKAKYPKRYIIWQIPIFGLKNFPLKITINPPIQKITKIKQKLNFHYYHLKGKYKAKKNIKGPINPNYIILLFSLKLILVLLHTLIYYKFWINLFLMTLK